MLGTSNVVNIVKHAARGLRPLRLTQLAAFGRYDLCGAHGNPHAPAPGAQVGLHCVPFCMPIWRSLEVRREEEGEEGV